MCSESGSERNGVVCVAKCVSMFYVTIKILFLLRTISRTLIDDGDINYNIC